MTNATEALRKELEEFQAKFKKQKAENTVECGGPEVKRTYTYQTGVSFRSIA